MAWRRTSAGHAVIAWRAARTEVRRVLAAEDVPAAVGPHRDGWTLVRVHVHGERVTEPRGRTVVDLVDDMARSLGEPGATCLIGEQGGPALIGCSGSALPAYAELPPPHLDEPADRRQWADLLGVLGAGDRLGPVLDAAAPPTTRGDGPPAGAVGRRLRIGAAMQDTRPQAVAVAAGLPAGLLDPALAGDPAPIREVVVCRGLDPVDAPFAASLLRVPLRVVETDRTALIVADPVDGTAMRLVAEMLASGRRAVLLVWRHGESRGYLSFRKGKIEDANAWTVDDDWEVVGLAPDLDPEFAAQLHTDLAPDRGDAELLVKRFGVAGALPDPVHLRAVLRRPSRPEVLTEFCDVLGLPPSIAGFVEHGAPAVAAAESTLVPPTSVASAIIDTALQPHPDDSWFVRLEHDKPWWFRAFDVAWAVAATAAAIMIWPDGGVRGLGAAVLLCTALLCVLDLALSFRAAGIRKRMQPDPPSHDEHRPHDQHPTGGERQSQDQLPTGERRARR